MASTAYSIDGRFVSAEQSVDGHTSASPGIWPMADCYIVLWLIVSGAQNGMLLVIYLAAVILRSSSVAFDRSEHLIMMEVLAPSVSG